MCLFCQIINGEIPSKKVYEDDNYLAILDISQTTKGHTLVMPKKHYDDISQINSQEFKELMDIVLKLAKKIVKNLNASGFNILINTGEVAGQSIKHAHVHIIPRYDDNDSISIEFRENDYNLDSILKQINND